MLQGKAGGGSGWRVRKAREGFAKVKCAPRPSRGVGPPSPPEAEALRLRQERPATAAPSREQTPPLSSSEDFRTGAEMPGKWSPSAEETRRLLGIAVQSWRVFRADSEVSVDGNVNKWRDAVLPPEVSDRNQSRGRGESGLGDPGDRPFVSCKYPVPAVFPPELGGIPREGGTGFGVQRAFAPAPLEGSTWFP